MSRKKLIFFTAADPRTDSGPAWSAYHFAEVAARAGLNAEVRLAGDAVRLAQPDGVANTDRGQELDVKVKAAVGGPFLVSL